MRIIKFSFIALILIIITSSCGTNRQIKAKTDYLSYKTGLKVSPKNNLKLYDEIVQWLGTPHCMGGTTLRCVDCSGFVNIIIKNVYGKDLGRSSQDMLANCDKIRKRHLKEGDLVFFNTSGSKSKKASHVGIYLQNGAFVHTSTKSGVMISNLDEPYYLKTWLSAGSFQ